MEEASSLVGEKKPVTEGEGAAPCRDACKSEKHKIVYVYSLFLHLALMVLKLIKYSVKVNREFLHRQEKLRASRFAVRDLSSLGSSYFFCFITPLYSKSATL